MEGRDEGLAELLRRWQVPYERDLWTRIRRQRLSEGRLDGAGVADRALADLDPSISAIDGLAANVDLVRFLQGWRWQGICLAREEGATWAEIADVLGVSEEDAWRGYQEVVVVQADLANRYGLAFDRDRAFAVADRPDSAPPVAWAGEVCAGCNNELAERLVAKPLQRQGRWFHPVCADTPG